MDSTSLHEVFFFPDVSSNMDSNKKSEFYIWNKLGHQRKIYLLNCLLFSVILPVIHWFLLVMFRI